MAEALAFEAAAAIVSEVVKRVTEEFKSPWVTKSDLEKLEKKLVFLQALLHDAGSRKYEEKRTVVNEWLKSVMDVAYYVEDVLDEYGYEEIRKKVEVGSRFKLKGSIIDFHTIKFKIRISKKAKKAMSLLEAIYKDAHDLGIKAVELTENESILPISSAFERYREEREFASYTSGFVGREDDVSKIEELMLSNLSGESSISIVAIKGMGGLGKTTLARRVYDSAKIREHFQKTVWICVSDIFSTKRILNEMVESLTASKCAMSNAEASKRALCKELGGQMYLLVLDDVWNTDHGKWESLLSCLYEIGGSLGTMVLVTTRDHEVVETVQAQAVHELQKLSEEESWDLFQQIVFKNELICDASDLVAIGRRIVEKCKGVPLAIKMLAGLLRSRKNAHAWKSIERSEIWELPQNRLSILPSLLLSFYYLPSPVKQCFSYCAIFPKDTVMSRNDLIRLWLAQGFLYVPGSSKSPEDIGEDYFNMLLSNSFLLLSRGIWEELGMDMECTMHDLVHDMAMFVSKTECLILKEEKEMDEASNVRHLTLLRDNMEADSDFVANRELDKLRTVHSHISITNKLLLNASNLRVLKLSRIGLTEIPAAIGGLKHCRYLDLSKNYYIDSLPDSITELYNLQTLQLEGCYRLNKFPEGMSKLVNLRHLPTGNYVEMPAGMKYLTRLQTLPTLLLQESGGGTIDEIGCLRDVRGALCIKGLECVGSKEAAVKASIGKKTAIVSLELSWDAERGIGISRSTERVKNGSTDEDVLDGLRPHPNLKQLEVVGYAGKKFAPWLIRMTVVDEMGNEASLNNLVKLRLFDCKNCEKLPTLGQLPCLRDLEISRMESLNVIGAEFYVYCEDSSVDGGGNVGKCGGRDVLFFPALRSLCLSQLPALTEWLAPPNVGRALSFPCLEDLRVRDCPRLLEIITHNSKNLELKFLRRLTIDGCKELLEIPSGLNCCTSLTELQIRDCDNIETVPTLRQLTNLERLRIFKCKKLTSLPEGHECLHRLRNLEIGGFQEELRSLPDEIGLLTTLEHLFIGNFSGIVVPEWIGNLSSLVTLKVDTWPNLKHLPSRTSMLQLSRLRCISISGCPHMMENCAKDVGPEWHKISHVPKVDIYRESYEDFW